MKFSARAGDVREALELASKVVPKTPSQAVYAGVRMRVRDSALTVTGSAEQDTTITASVPVTGASNGDVVLVPKPIATYLATVEADKPLTVSSSATELHVQAADHSPYRFRLMEASFPNTSVPAAQEFSTDLSRLAAAVRAVRDAAGPTGVIQLVSIPGAGVRLYSTDNKRLAAAALPEAEFGQFSGLLTVQALEQIGQHAMTQVALDRRGRVLTAANDHVRVITRMADESFPDVRGVLEHQRPDRWVQLPVRAVRDRLNRLASVAAGRGVHIQLAGDQLILSASDVATGTGVEHLDLESPCLEEVTLVINLDFVRAALSAHLGPVVHLGWTEPQMPVFLASTEPMPVTTVVMPIAL